MDRHHRSGDNAESLIQQPRQRGQRIGGARRVRDDPVRAKLPFVGPQHHRHARRSRGARNQHAPRPGGQGAARHLGPVGPPGAFHHHIHPGQVQHRKVGFPCQGNAPSVQHQSALFQRDRPCPDAEDAVVFKQIGAHVGGGDVIDPDNLDLRPAALQPGPQHRTSDPAKAVHHHPHRLPFPKRPRLSQITARAGLQCRATVAIAVSAVPVHAGRGKAGRTPRRSGAPDADGQAGSRTHVRESRGNRWFRHGCRAAWHQFRAGVQACRTA